MFGDQKDYVPNGSHVQKVIDFTIQDKCILQPIHDSLLKKREQLFQHNSFKYHSNSLSD